MLHAEHLQHDFPEERVDNVISVMVTVSDVEASNDLQVVKVFVSILGDDQRNKTHQRAEKDGGLLPPTSRTGRCA